MSPPEQRLWAELSGRKLDGLKFRRQHPLDPYILDFYCPEKRLCVEVDGESHSMGDNPERDIRRDAFLTHAGIRTLRLSARTVLHDMGAALRTIQATLQD